MKLLESASIHGDFIYGLSSGGDGNRHRISTPKLPFDCYVLFNADVRLIETVFMSDKSTTTLVLQGSHGAWRSPKLVSTN